jgi:hypothetical protein
MPPTIAAATCGGSGKAIHDPRGIPNRRAGGFPLSQDGKSVEWYLRLSGNEIET